MRGESSWWVQCGRNCCQPQFELLREHLLSFPDLELETADYEEAAAAFNRWQRFDAI